MSNHRTIGIVFASISITAIAAVMVTPAVGQQAVASPAQQAEVERKGATVMPFDQQRAMHMFQQTPTGGVQTVLSRDGDFAQIAAIRSHLRQEADKFARGDFSDPATIHGQQMPGLSVLKTAGQNLRVAYQELPLGAQMTFTTHDPATVTALHDWFAAQVSEHGSHAMMMK